MLSSLQRCSQRATSTMGYRPVSGPIRPQAAGGVVNAADSCFVPSRIAALRVHCSVSVDACLPPQFQSLDCRSRRASDNARCLVRRGVPHDTEDSVCRTPVGHTRRFPYASAPPGSPCCRRGACPDSTSGRFGPRRHRCRWPGLCGERTPSPHHVRRSGCSERRVVVHARRELTPDRLLAGPAPGIP